MNHPAEHAVTVLVSRRVKAGNEADFERVASQLLELSARAPGYLGSQLMHPGEEPGVDDSLYHVVLAFDNQANLDAWQNSTERALGLAAAEPYIEGPTTLRRVSGMAMWFRTPAAVAPPRWKVAVVTWLGICPTVYLMFRLTWDLISAWWLLPRVVLLTLVVVILMTWVVAPALSRVFRSWLFARSGPGR